MHTDTRVTLYPAGQDVYSQPLADIPSAVAAALHEVGIREEVGPGKRVAITAGSRGIASIPVVLRSVAQVVRDCGGEPFLVPAMGSHGGATAEGQVNVLASLGITEETVRAPIRSSMETVQLGETESGMPVFLDRNAAGADAIVVVNRVKQHSDFSGPLESGLMKMVAIGLGKRDQPEMVHSYGAPGLRKHIPEVARAKIARSNIRIGLGLFEDGLDHLRAVRACRAEEMEEREMAWLEEVRQLAPRIPFHEVDLLIVEQLGKDVSGAGMDTRVIGRWLIPGEPEPASPRIERIVVLDLTEATHGNAVGIGLADFVTRRLLDKIDWNVTYTNGIVSNFLQRCFTPIVMEDESAAIRAALSTLGRRKPNELRVLRIRDTLHLGQFYASQALLDLQVPGVQRLPGEPTIVP